MPRSRLALVATLVGLAALAAGCGSGPATSLAPFSGASLTIQARDIAFHPTIVTMPAGEPLRLVLDNEDAGVGHNLHVFQGSTDLGQSPTVVGPGVAAVELPALPPGRYQFQCTIHPGMIGTIIVQAGASPGAAGSDAPAGS
jgi:plastocyanin